MKNKLLTTFALLGLGVSCFAQSIETPANTALTITSDITLPSTRAIRVDGNPFIRFTTQASGNVLMGFGVGQTGSNNTFIGGSAGSANTIGGDNVFIGQNSGRSNIDGSFNLFVGGNAGQANTTGRENLFFGSGSGFSNVGGRFNTFIGLNSGYANTAGENNTFIGQRAGFSNQGGNGNLFVGAESGRANTSGTFNTFLGNGAGYSNLGGGNNTFVGLNSGFKTTGSENVALGRDAGLENVGGQQNTFIGTGAGVNPGVTVSNAVAIGYNSRVSVSNALVLGNNVNVGIGTSSPTARLEVSSGVANTAGLKLTNLTNTSPASVTGATKFLSVDGSGNVVLASLNASPRVATSSDAVGVSESYWQLAGGRLSNSSGEAVVIGKGISKLGGNYGLYVEKGILTEKVKVAIKNTSDWSDFVFAPGYQLRKLSEVERFIKSHGHLPGVPSAAQVVAEGVDMAKMDATLLQKIEELTLYMVDMKKEVNAMRQENVKLRQKNNTIERQIKQIRHSSK